jgi:hypothetical protein
MEIFYGDLYLSDLPNEKSLQWLAALRRTLALNVPLGQLAKQAQNLPLLLLTRYQGRDFRKLLNAHPELQEYLTFKTRARYIAGLWSWQTQTQPEPEPEPPLDLAVFPQLAGLIAGEESPAAQALALCAQDPKSYFHAHLVQYQNRNRASPGPAEEICLLALADQLIEAGLAYELDWKTEKEDFLFFVQQLADAQRAGLPLCPDWFDETLDMADWVELLNEKWAETGFYLAELAMDNDSFTLLCVSLDLLDRLRSLAPALFH